MSFSRLLVFSLLTAAISKALGSGVVIGGPSPVYGQLSETVTLKWSYRVLSPSALLYVKICRTPILSSSCDDWDVGKTPIAFGAASSPAQPITSNSDYYSRIQLSTLNNEVTLEVRRLTELDTGGFRFEMQMSDGIAFNVTQVIIVVNPQITGDRSPIISVDEFDNVTMPCTAGVGNPRPLKFTWKRRAEDPRNPDVFIAESWEMHSFHLNLSRVGRQNRGIYKCIVENRYSFGSDIYEVELRIRYRPVIVGPPLNRTVLENSGEAFMDCSADGSDGSSKPFAWHWYKDTPQVWRAIQSGITHSEITISGDGSRLVFTKPPRTLAGFYFCAAENTLGIGAAQGAVLNVTYPPGKVEVPLVDGQVVGRERENLTVKCFSDANPPAVYSWYKEVQFFGAPRFILLLFRDSSGSLQLFNASRNDSSKYKCVAENRPNLLSPTAWESSELIVPLNIYYAPRVTNITVNERNDSKIYIKKGQKAAIVCRSDSNPPAIFNIQKQGEGTKLGSDAGIYTIDSIDIVQEGVYQCIARNEILGSFISVSIEIIVTVEASLLSSSENQSPREGAYLDLECTFIGKPAPYIFWQFYGSNFTNDSVRQTSYVVLRRESVLTTVQSKLSFSGVRHTDDGFFSCIAYNYDEKLNKTIKFDVSYAPKITVHPQNYTLLEGSGKGFNLVCNAKGKPDVASWLWKKDGIEISNVKNNFEMQVPKREDNGIYTCQGRNAVGVGELGTAVVVIQYRAQLTVWPQSQVMNISGSVTLMCDGIGVPEPIYLWLKNGDNTFRREGRTITFANVDARSKGEYSCSANNSVGGDTRMFLIQVQHPPEITSNYRYQTKVGADVGGEAVLTCAVDSYPAAVIAWRIAGQTNALSSGDEYTIRTFSNGGSSNLEVRVKEKHVGMKFICEARNSFGQDEQEFQILLRQKPEPPELIEVSDELQPTVPATVDIKLKWIPGFNGGRKVDFFLHYREASQLSDRIENMGSAVDNVYVLRMQKTNTKYTFSIRARNDLGSSALYEPRIDFITKDSPPDVANVSLTRVGDGSTVLVSWRISGSAATRKRRSSRRKRAADNNWDYALIRVRNIDANEMNWAEYKVSNIQLNGSYAISGLNQNDLYEFQFILYDKNGRFARPVSAGKLRPGKDGPVVKQSRSPLSSTNIIIIAASCGGFILILVLIFCVVMWRNKSGSFKKREYSAQPNGNKAQDIPIPTMKSGYSYHSASGADVVRSSIAPEVEEDSFTGNDTENHFDKPPPGYNDFHYNYNEGSDYNDAPASTFRPADDSTPRYTSFGRLPKENVKSVAGAGQLESKSLTSLNGNRAGEISRRKKPLKSGNVAPGEDDALLKNDFEDLPTRGNHSRENSVGGLSTDEELPEPPSFMREALRNPQGDKGKDVRAPGSFGDQIGVRQQKPAKRAAASYGSPPPAPVSFLNPSGQHSPSSSQASSKPYKSDNEYIDDVDENYVGFLV